MHKDKAELCLFFITKMVILSFFCKIKKNNLLFFKKIRQMVAFIDQEATEKAAEIESKVKKKEDF